MYGRTSYPRRTRSFTSRTNGAWRNDPMTETQAGKIAGELRKRAIDPALRAELLAAVNNGVTRDGSPATKGSASDLINWLLAKDLVSGAPAAAPKSERNGEMVTVEGIYRFTDGSVYRVVESKRNPGRFVAKMVTAHGWEYAKGMIFKLTAEMRMTPEQIAEFGIRSGVCAQCSRNLEDPISKRIGLGTKCGPAILGRPEYNAARKSAKLDPQVAEQLAAIEAGKGSSKEADEAEAAAYAEIGEFPSNASGAVQDLYWKIIAAQREAEQEREAEEAKFAYKQSVERF
jgi:hypothetical protein